MEGPDGEAGAHGFCSQGLLSLLLLTFTCARTP
jgi:hypothetical protein